MKTPHRSGWVVLLAVAGAVLGGTLAVRAAKRKRTARPTPPPVPLPRAAVAPTKLLAGTGTDPSRALVRMAVAAGIVVVLALVIVIVTRPPDDEPTADPAAALSSSTPAAPTAPMSLADCQAAFAAGADPYNRSSACGYSADPAGETVDETAANPDDPRYAGAALATFLSTDGHSCVTGLGRPVLDTIRPALTASFTGGPGLRRVESTFQVTGLDGRTDEDVQQPGRPGPPGLSATLDFSLLGSSLAHGQSYRWRVRATPPTVAAGGWSTWCEFTVAAVTSDDLGLDERRNYPVSLPTARWRAIRQVLGPVETYSGGGKSVHAPIEAATRMTAPTASVTMTGEGWKSIVNSLAYSASKENSPAYWALADSISAALHGPPHPTMGFPRH